MNKKIIAIIVVIIIVVGVWSCNFNDSLVINGSTVEGYVREVNLDGNSILICYDLKNISNEEYMGDCWIPIDEYTVISDDRTLDSIEQGEYIIATYTGTVAEVWPEEIEGTILIQFVK